MDLSADMGKIWKATELAMTRERERERKTKNDKAKDDTPPADCVRATWCVTRVINWLCKGAFVRTGWWPDCCSWRVEEYRWNRLKASMYPLAAEWGGGDVKYRRERDYELSRKLHPPMAAPSSADHFRRGSAAPMYRPTNWPSELSVSNPIFSTMVIPSGFREQLSYFLHHLLNYSVRLMNQILFTITL